MKKILALFLVVGCHLLGFSQVKTKVDPIFIQKGLAGTGSDRTKAGLMKAPFAIRFNGKEYTDKHRYAVQVAVLDNEKDAKLLAVGKSISSIPFFEPGTGMTPNESGLYETIYVSNSGHHYIVYDEKEDKRAKLISRTDDSLVLSWPIDKVFYNEEEVSIRDLKLNTLWFAFLFDANLNGMVDEGEFEVIEVSF